MKRRTGRRLAACSTIVCFMKMNAPERNSFFQIRKEKKWNLTTQYVVPLYLLYVYYTIYRVVFQGSLHWFVFSKQAKWRCAQKTTAKFVQYFFIILMFLFFSANYNKGKIADCTKKLFRFWRSLLWNSTVTIWILAAYISFSA